MSVFVVPLLGLKKLVTPMVFNSLFGRWSGDVGLYYPYGLEDFGLGIYSQNTFEERFKLGELIDIGLIHLCNFPGKEGKSDG